MSKSDVIKQLRAAITGQVIDDPDIMGAYRHDQCLMAPAGDPLVVVHAQSSDDVIATLRVAQESRTPVVTRGAGTGLAGGGKRPGRGHRTLHRQDD